MPSSPFAAAVERRRPSSLLARAAAWPAVVLLLSAAASLTQLYVGGGGLLGLVVLFVACGVLAAVDASVLRPGQVALVWSATLVVLAAVSRTGALPSVVQVAPLMGQSLAVELLPTLPRWFPVTSVALVLPVTLGALLGRCCAGAELPSTFGPLGPSGPIG